MSSRNAGNIRLYNLRQTTTHGTCGAEDSPSLLRSLAFTALLSLAVGGLYEHLVCSIPLHFIVRATKERGASGMRAPSWITAGSMTPQRELLSLSISIRGKSRQNFGTQPIRPQPELRPILQLTHLARLPAAADAIVHYRPVLISGYISQRVLFI